MSDAWDGIPPTGADETGWHWLQSRVDRAAVVPMYWCQTAIGGKLLRFNAHSFARTIEEDFDYIAPCPAPEGYQP